MIDAKELRIGNYVEYSTIENDFNEVLRKIYAKDIVRIDEGDYYYIYNPIPLTEEILLKCGFKLEIFEWVLSFGFYSIWGFIGDKFTLYSNGDETETEIEYLHQLQNLYWCLVGEELEINL